MNTFTVPTECPYCKKQVEVEVPVQDLEQMVRVFKSMRRTEQVTCPEKECGQSFTIIIE